jgi:hypothetical protein
MMRYLLYIVLLAPLTMDAFSCCKRKKPTPPLNTSTLLGQRLQRLNPPEKYIPQLNELIKTASLLRAMLRAPDEATLTPTPYELVGRYCALMATQLAAINKDYPVTYQDLFGEPQHGRSFVDVVLDSFGSPPKERKSQHVWQDEKDMSVQKAATDSTSLKIVITEPKEKHEIKMIS